MSATTTSEPAVRTSASSSVPEGRRSAGGEHQRQDRRGRDEARRPRPAADHAARLKPGKPRWYDASAHPSPRIVAALLQASSSISQRPVARADPGEPRGQDADHDPVHGVVPHVVVDQPVERAPTGDGGEQDAGQGRDRGQDTEHRSQPGRHPRQARTWLQLRVCTDARRDGCYDTPSCPPLCGHGAAGGTASPSYLPGGRPGSIGTPVPVPPRNDGRLSNPRRPPPVERSTSCPV